MSAIAIIPARGGSVRIPRKNIRSFWGKPIMAYSIIAAQESGVFDKILVSTDDKEIAAVADRYGADVWWRPQDDGTKGTQEVTAGVLREHHGYDFACCLYATAPMVFPTDLVRGDDHLFKSTFDYVVSVGEWLKDPGMFYFGRARAFLSDAPLLSVRTGILPVNAHRCCDINTEEDWLRAERMYAELKGLK